MKYVTHDVDSYFRRVRREKIVARCIVLAIIILLCLSLLTNVTLFEDGSVQFYNKVGWSFCLYGSWGCS